MKNLNIILVMLLVVSVTACSSITGGRKIDYKSTTKRSTLEIPPDLSSLPASQRESGITTYSGYTAEQSVKGPGSSAILPKFPGVTIKRSGTQRWLVVKSTPQEIWPQLREFVFGLGLAIARENKVTGVIETDWAENRVGLIGGGKISRFFKSFLGTSTRDKYRIRIDEGKTKGKTEIYLTHQGLEEVVSRGGGTEITQTLWQRRPSDPELEAELLRLLMIHLGVEDVRARNMLTAGIGRARARLEFDDDDVAHMRLTDNFGNAWRRVGRALDKLGVKIESKDRNKGLYTVAISDIKVTKKKPGFFSKMLGLGEKRARHYRLRISAARKGSEAQLLDAKKDRRISSPDGKRFMRSLFEELR